MGKIQPGYYRLKDTEHYEHNYLWLNQYGNHSPSAWYNVSSSTGFNYTYPKDFYRDSFSLLKDFPNAPLHNSQLWIKRPSYLQELVTSLMKGQSIEAVKVFAEEEPIKLGPLELSDPNRMSHTAVIKAQDKLTARIQRTLRAWPLNKKLHFEVTATHLKAYWVEDYS